MVFIIYYQNRTLLSAQLFLSISGNDFSLLKVGNSNSNQDHLPAAVVISFEVIDLSPLFNGVKRQVLN